MSFWNGMKRAFGFSPEEEEEEGDYDPTLPTYAVDKAPTMDKASIVDKAPIEKPTERTDNNTISSQPIATNIGDDSLPADLFDAVIKLFNEQQPEFVRTSLSTDAQRSYIINAISDSLKSRIKSAGTPATTGHDEDIETLRKENRRLQLSVDRQKRALLDRINDLEAQVTRFNAEKEQIYTKKKLPVDTTEIDNAKSRIAELEKENTNLAADLKEKTSIEQQLQAKIKVSDVLINDLRNENAASRNELEKIQGEQETVLSEIQSQLDGFEQLKARKDAKIAECTKRINELNEENESLRHTIENNLYNQANSERELREEIQSLRNRLETAEANTANDGDEIYGSAQESRQSRRRGRPKKVRIDNSLDNTDWFASGKKDDPDFGYHEPPHRPVNDNEAQLSLF